METKIGSIGEMEHGTEGSVKEYGEGAKRLIETEMKNLVEEEISKASQELLEEQKKAIQELVEEHKLVVKKVVEEEKKAMWAILDATEIITKLREEAERVSKETTEKVKKESGESPPVITETKQKAEQLVNDAKEVARGEAGQIIKGAWKGVVVLGEEAERQAELEVPSIAKVTAQQSDMREAAGGKVPSTEEDGELYQGKVELAIVSPTDIVEAMRLQQYLCQVANVHVLSVGGSAAGTQIVISVEKPIPLLQILRGMLPVKQALKEGKKVRVTLKAHSNY